MEQKRIFDEYMDIKYKIQYLAAPVQNIGFKPTNQDLEDFENLSKGTIIKLQELQTRVVKLYKSEERNG